MHNAQLPFGVKYFYKVLIIMNYALILVSATCENHDVVEQSSE